MTKSQMVKIARIAVDKGMNYEELYYSDYLYGHEADADHVWEYVVECKEIGTTAFDAKHGVNP